MSLRENPAAEDDWSILSDDVVVFDIVPKMSSPPWHPLLLLTCAERGQWPWGGYRALQLLRLKSSDPPGPLLGKLKPLLPSIVRDFDLTPRHDKEAKPPLLSIDDFGAVRSLGSLTKLCIKGAHDMSAWTGLMAALSSLGGLRELAFDLETPPATLFLCSRLSALTSLDMSVAARVMLDEDDPFGFGYLRFPSQAGLSALTGLRSLTLRGLGVDVGPWFKPLTALTSIKFEFDNDGVQPDSGDFSHLPTGLQSLELSLACRLSDDLSPFKRLTNLTRLLVEGSSSLEAQALADLLPHLANLRSLKLILLFSASVEPDVFMPCLSGLQFLTEFGMLGMPTDGEELEHLSKLSLDTLSLDLSIGPAASILPQVGRLTSLRDLKVWVEDATETDLRHLSKLSSLTAIETSISKSKGNRDIFPYHGLTSLSFSASSLRSLKLSTFSISKNSGDGPWPFLTSLRKLTELELNDYNIDDMNLPRLLSHLKRLRSLDLNHCNGLSDKCVESLASLPSLSKLVLTRIPVRQLTVAGIRQLIETAPALEVLYVGPLSSEHAENKVLKRRDTVRPELSIKIEPRS